MRDETVRLHTSHIPAANPAQTERLKRGDVSQVFHLLITQEAEQAITGEVLLFGTTDRETGGIVVGRWLDDQTVLIIAATGAGPQASRERLSFSLDVDYINQRLARLRLIYAAADYIGEWHKHPITLPRPSAGDVQTARGLLRDPSYPNRLINPIAVWNGERVSINYYYLDAAQGDFARLMPQKISLQRGKEMLDAQIIAPKMSESAWWYGVAGRRRLESEIGLLAANGYVINRNERSDDTTWEVATEKNGRAFVFRCGAGFPQTPPAVCTWVNGIEDARAHSETLSGWQPDNHLYQVCRDVGQAAHHYRTRNAFLITVGCLAIALLLVLFVLLHQPQPSTPPEVSPATATAYTTRQEGIATQQADTSGTIGAVKSGADATSTVLAQNYATQDARVRATVGAFQPTYATQRAALTAGASPSVTQRP